MLYLHLDENVNWSIVIYDKNVIISILGKFLGKYLIKNVEKYLFNVFWYLHLDEILTEPFFYTFCFLIKEALFAWKKNEIFMSGHSKKCETARKVI